MTIHDQKNQFQTAQVHLPVGGVHTLVCPEMCIRDSLILFVVLIGYYGFLIFMDIQHLKAAEAAAQENQSEEEIDITDEARSFQPQQRCV